MAINLNKGGEGKPTFNLSKSQDTTSDESREKNQIATTTSIGKKRNKFIGLFALAGIIILAGCIWYFTSSNNGDSRSDKSFSQGTTEVSEKPIQDQPQANVSDLSKTNDIRGAGNTGDSVGNSLPGVENVVLSNSVAAGFTAGSASLGAVNDKMINEIINYLSKSSNAKIVVNGYASSEGLFQFNQELSQQRADAFKALLVSKGINEDRIDAAGKGSSNPVASNDVEEGRIKNRRVEVSFQ